MLGLGTNSLGIGLVIHLRDRFTANANNVMASMNRMHKNARMVMRQNLATMRQVGFGMMMAGGMGVRAMAGWVKEGSKFRFTMDAVGAVTHSTTEQMHAMSEKALDLAGKTVFTVHEIADAFKYLGMAGFSPKDIQGTVDAVAALGAATDTHIGGKGGAADMMTNMMTAFGMTADESMRASNIMSKATVSANINIMDLHEALKYSAADFTTLGISFEEATASIMMMGNAGIQGSIAGTAMGNMLRKLSIAMTDFGTKRQLKGLNQFGIEAGDVVDELGNMKNLVDVMDVFMKKISGGNVKALAAIQAITGIRGARGLIPLIREIKMGKTFREYADMLTNVKETEALDIASARMNNLTGDTLLLTSAWSKFKVRFTEALEPILRPLAQTLIKIVDLLSRFARTGFGKFVMVGIALFAVLVAVAGAFMVILGTIGLMASNVGVGFGAMLRAGKWAFNVLIGRALTYLGVMRGINAAHGINVAGSVFSKSTGRIVTTAASMRGGGMLGRFLRWVTRMVPIFGRLVPMLLRFLPVIGWVIAAMVALKAIGFKLKDLWSFLAMIVTVAIGTIVNQLIVMKDFLTGNWSGMFDRAAQRQAGYFRGHFDEEQRERLGMMGRKVFGKPEGMAEETHGYLRGGEAGYLATMPGAAPPSKTPTVLNVHIDGKESIKHVVQEAEDTTIHTELGIQ